MLFYDFSDNGLLLCAAGERSKIVIDEDGSFEGRGRFWVFFGLFFDFKWFLFLLADISPEKLSFDFFLFFFDSFKKEHLLFDSLLGNH